MSKDHIRLTDHSSFHNIYVDLFILTTLSHTTNGSRVPNLKNKLYVGMDRPTIFTSSSPSKGTGSVIIGPRKIDTVKITRGCLRNENFHMKLTKFPNFLYGNRLFGDQTSLGKYKVIKIDNFG